MVPTLLVPTDYAAEPIDVRLDPDDADDLGDLDQPEDDDDAVDDAAAARLFAKAGDLDAARVFRSVLVKDPDDPAAVQIADATFPRYRRAQERAWTALAAAVHDRALLPAIQRGDASAIVDALGLPALRAAITGPLHAYGRPAFLRGAELALRTLPPHAQRAPIAISLQEMNPEAAKWADREAAKLVREIGPETEAAIRALIVDAVATGIPPVEVARRIRAMVGLLESQVAAVIRFEQDLIKQGVAADTAAKRADKYAAAQRRLRATTIARTELMAATNHGQQSLWELARLRGVLSAKTIRVWIVTHDDRLDKKICEPLDGAEAGLSEPFPGGHLVPPAHPRCRCTVGIKTI
jgi:hypothetical protein